MLLQHITQDVINQTGGSQTGKSIHTQGKEISQFRGRMIGTTGSVEVIPILV